MRIVLLLVNDYAHRSLLEAPLDLAAVDQWSLSFNTSMPLRQIFVNLDKSFNNLITKIVRNKTELVKKYSL